MPTARHGAAGGIIGDKLYVAGGFSALTQTSTDVLEIYDAQAAAWTVGPPMDIPVHFAVGAVAAGELFLIGGRSGTSFQLIMQRFDPQTNSWTVEPQPFGVVEISHAQAVGDESFLYVVGRFGSHTQIGVWRFDPAANLWSQLSDALPTTVLPAVSLSDERIYAAGGIVSGGGGFIPVDTLEIYDLVTDTWTVAAPMPTARAIATAGVIDGKTLVVGAWNPPPDSERLAVLEIYDPLTDAWEVGPMMPTARGSTVSGVIGGRLLVAGGNDGLPTSVLEIYDPNDNRVCVCHYPPGNSSNPQTTCVGAKAAENHVRRHGDTVGECRD